jgi:hypothetical protein
LRVAPKAEPMAVRWADYSAVLKVPMMAATKARKKADC